MKKVLLATAALALLATCISPAQQAAAAIDNAPVAQTGQTTIYISGDDGALQKGVDWPIPRFTDNGKGNIRDNLTKLIWLKNANCPGDTGSLGNRSRLRDGAQFVRHHECH